jgi:MoaA/NifB/PqqE/SkfB family radical SAM enzyme
MDNVYKLLKLNKFVRSHRIKLAGVMLAELLNMRHLFVRLDPVLACNIRCRMCFFSNDEYRQAHKGMFTAAEIERIGRFFFPKALQVVVGCGAEPTLYKDYAGIVKLAKDYGVPYVGLVSNGQLLDGPAIDRLVANGLDELIISTHGVTKETYEKFMVGASYEKLLAVLECVGAAKAKTGKPKLRLNYTVNPDNLAELADIFATFPHFDVLQVRPVMSWGGDYGGTMEGFVEQHNAIIDALIAASRERNVTLLANKIDPLYKGDGYDGFILNAVLRFVTPECVWREDFNWREEEYADYCRRTGWSKQLLKWIGASRQEIVEKYASDACTYNIF